MGYSNPLLAPSGVSSFVGKKIRGTELQHIFILYMIGRVGDASKDCGKEREGGVYYRASSVITNKERYGSPK